jgi:hypothetical protein
MAFFPEPPGSGFASLAKPRSAPWAHRAPLRSWHTWQYPAPHGPCPSDLTGLHALEGRSVFEMMLLRPGIHLAVPERTGAKRTGSPENPIGT